MIKTTDEVNAILNEDPDVDMVLFWNRVGYDSDLMIAVIKAHAIMAGIPIHTAGALIETGATLAEAGIKRIAPQDEIDADEPGNIWGGQA